MYRADYSLSMRGDIQTNLINNALIRGGWSIWSFTVIEIKSWSTISARESINKHTDKRTGEKNDTSFFMVSKKVSPLPIQFYHVSSLLILDRNLFNYVPKG